MHNLCAGFPFSEVRIDKRVNVDLEVCLYCVVQYNEPEKPDRPVNSFIAPKATGYQVKLNILNEFFKQCPSCGTVYLAYPQKPE